MTTNGFTVVGVPIDSVGFGDGDPRGTERAPSILRNEGLLPRLGWLDDGDLSVRITGHDRDPRSGLVGLHGVLETTDVLRADTAARVRHGQRPFLVGGCCTLLVGALAGARDALGEVGLVYVDGHMDLYDGTTSPTGEPADMPIAVLLGRGPAAWNERAAPVPVVEPPAVALLGFRDTTELADLEPQLATARQDGVLAMSEADIRAAGLTEAARRALDHVGRATDRLWLHIDLDVLGEAVFPATDYLMPGGLDWDELLMLLEPIVETSGLVGWSLACYNPDKDSDRRHGRAIVRAIERLFG